MIVISKGRFCIFGDFKLVFVVFRMIKSIMLNVEVMNVVVVFYKIKVIKFWVGEEEFFEK